MTSSFSERLAAALSLHQTGETAKAAERYADLLREAEHSGAESARQELRYYQAVMDYQAGRFEDAIAKARQTLPGGPMEARAHNLIGLCLAKSGKAKEAIGAFNAAIRTKPNFADAHGNLANALVDLGRSGEALAAYDQALKLRPDSPEDWANRGSLLLDLGHADEALDSFDRAIALAPEIAATHFNRGNALRDLGRAEDALGAYDQALALEPELAAAWVNRAIALRTVGRLPGAWQSIGQALEIDPDNPLALAARGNLFHEAGDYDAAYADFDRAAKLEPTLASAKMGRGLVALTHGNWADGFRDFEERVRLPNPAYTPLPFPRWQGDEPKGERLILLCEQGFGDIIQFARFAPWLRARGHDVAVFCRPNIVRLLSSLDGVLVTTSLEELNRDGRPLCWAPMMSVPGLIGINPETVPSQLPYLSAEPERIDSWGRRIGQEGFRIGIAWRTGPSEPSYLSWRSIPLERFSTLAALPDIRLISLQQGAANELAACSFGAPIETLGEDADKGEDRFIDTAAAMMHLDLIVTADTSIAHLAGALGRPVFLALPSVPEWRWLLEREDTPWYSSMRLFRQIHPGDWHELFNRLTGSAEMAARHRVRK